MVKSRPSLAFTITNGHNQRYSLKLDFLKRFQLLIYMIYNIYIYIYIYIYMYVRTGVRWCGTLPNYVAIGRWLTVARKIL